MRPILNRFRTLAISFLHRISRPLQALIGRSIDRCAECPLAACRAGRRTVVVALACEQADACRLRALGLLEGTHVTVLQHRDGMLLDVRGSRIALGASLASSVIVRPLAA